jgi:hypothetical protein
MAVELEQALDDLYGADLDEFVKERNRIATDLRKEGRRAEAAQVNELRKPSLSAWTVNQLARRNRKEVDLLLDAGHRLVAAQSDVVAGGDPARFDEAREREQDALRKLRQAARKILGDRTASGTIERVSSTLRAAAVSEEGREQLARGRLADDVESSGFEAFAGMVPPATSAPRSKAKPKPKRQDESNRREQLARARAVLKAARDREAESTRQLRDAEKTLAQARRAQEDAEAAVEDAEADRRAAAEETEAAERALDDARNAS